LRQAYDYWQDQPGSSLDLFCFLSILFKKNNYSKNRTAFLSHQKGKEDERLFHQKVLMPYFIIKVHEKGFLFCCLMWNNKKRALLRVLFLTFSHEWNCKKGRRGWKPFSLFVTRKRIWYDAFWDRKHKSQSRPF